MCRRAYEPGLGQWSPPSGFLECGESLEEGASRETFEETGLVIKPTDLELYAVVNMTAIEQVAISFRVELVSLPSLKTGLECLEVAFLSEEEISRKNLAWRESIGTTPRQLFGEIRSDRFSIQLISIGSGSGVGFKSRVYTIASKTLSGPIPDDSQ
jgi:ADP-ribose pyrophosphatase YjhB (NUDIX family)